MLCFAPVALCLLAPFTLVQEPETPKEEPAFADPFGPQEIQSIAR